MDKCDSPNVVRCISVLQSKDIKLIVMEYCNRGDLLQEINKRGRIPEREAVPIIKQIINGIAVSIYLARNCTPIRSFTEISSPTTSYCTTQRSKFVT